MDNDELFSYLEENSEKLHEVNGNIMGTIKSTVLYNIYLDY